MANSIDSVGLFALNTEIKPALEGCFLQKISQLTELDFGLHFRRPGDSLRMVLCLRPEKARWHRISGRFPQAQVPSSFIMLCRKYCEGKKLLRLEHPDMERLFKLHFSSEFTLVVELLGRKNHLLLLNPDGKILGAVPSSPRFRPGRVYEPPEPAAVPHFHQLEAPPAGDDPLEGVFGLPKFRWRRLQEQAGGWSALVARLRQGNFSPGLDKERLLLDADPPQFDSLAQAEAARWGEQAEQPGLEQEKKELRRRLKKLRDKAERKRDKRDRDLSNARRAEGDKLKGDLLLTYASKVGHRRDSIELTDWEGRPLTIALDPQLRATDNAEKYYQRYKKKLRAQPILEDLVSQSDQELAYLDELELALDLAESRLEVEEIQRNLPSRTKRKRPAAPSSGPRKFRYRGFEMLVGRNPAQNDRLVTLVAARDDLWFHIRDAAGSHVILRRGGREPDPEVLQVAATLAARYSRSASENKARVNYTQVRYLKKPPGAPPGKVLYREEKTMLVEPDFSPPGLEALN